MRDDWQDKIQTKNLNKILALNEATRTRIL